MIIAVAPLPGMCHLFSFIFAEVIKVVFSHKKKLFPDSWSYSKSDDNEFSLPKSVKVKASGRRCSVK